MIKTQTLKGFRDFLPQTERKRQYAVNILKKVFELYGFTPIETPSLEYEEILTGKYGKEGDKLMYKFTDNGGRRVALRYDQTVPLARVVAQYQNELPMPFKRYQMQNVWRAENTQKGRYREFLQCDIDTIGVSSFLSDAEIIACALEAVKKLGFKCRMRINDRKIFNLIFEKVGIKQEETKKRAVTIIDKLNKIGAGGVFLDMEKAGIKNSREILDELGNVKETDMLQKLFEYLSKIGLKKGLDFIFDQTLARGLDYYTGFIFELEQVEVEKVDVGVAVPGTVITPKLSLGGGGRYDNLIGTFANKQIPAVGFAFGFDRIIEAMDELNLFPKDLFKTKVLVTVFTKEFLDKSLELVFLLRNAGVETELYLDQNAPLDKQLKYADRKGMPFIAIIGPEEAAEGKISIKNMNKRESLKMTKEEIIAFFSKKNF